jgi:PST family polysaccharide transporter
LKKGLAINFVAKYSNIIIQILITSVLARLLTPKEYGVISVVTIFIVFFNMLGDMGIGPAIIQYKDLDEDDISSIFIFTFFIGVILSVVFFAFSYFIAYIYNTNIYVPIGHLLCFVIMLNVFCIVPNNLLLKDKQFKIVGISALVSNVISGSITILLAYVGFSYYALVFNSIIQAFINFLILFYFSKVKIKIKKYSMKPIKRISNFSIYQFLFNFINYFSRNFDNLLIGKYIGINQLGYYDKAYKLMLYPVQNLTFVITPVLQPVLSDYQNDKEIILCYYKKIVKILALLGAFISVFCFFSAREIILIMFGNQWGGSIITFKILSISIIIQMVLSTTGSIFQSTGYTDKLFQTGFLSTIITIILILIGLMLKKIEYIATAILISFIINFFISYFILIKKVFKKSLSNFLFEFKSVIFIIMFMSIIYKILNLHINNTILSFICKFLIAIIAYIIGLYITKDYKVFKQLIKRS